MKPYMEQPWFALLAQRCNGAGVLRKDVAAQLGISPVTLSMVLNGSGPYGDGTAQTRSIAERVEHTFGRYVCPYLTGEAGNEVCVTATECRGFAHREAPPATPRAMQHWQACRQCAHLGASAPPVVRVPVPRKTRHATSPTDQESHDASRF